MLNADRAVRMGCCPRCGAGGFESLRSHSYCVECNYSEVSESDEMLAIPKWVLEILKPAKKKKDEEQNNHYHSGRLLALA